MMSLKFRCDECNWVGLDAEIKVVQDQKDNSWQECPNCKTPEQFTNLCDESNCNNEAVCGWPSDKGFRRTCFRHWKRNVQ